MRGKFIIIDGIDGSGKGEFIKAVKEQHQTFDLTEYTRDNYSLPDLSKIHEDIIISQEPTNLFIGRAIKDYLLKEKHSADTTAHAFALDRLILYKEFIIPALKSGKTIIQERGIVSSLVYQPVQLERMSLRDIMNIEGNAIAIKNSPDYVIIVKGNPEVIARRSRKKGDTIFNSLFFQRKIEERFESEWLKQVFERFGSKVIYLDSNCSLDELKEKSLNILNEQILKI